jgi:hypothetical protein
MSCSASHIQQRKWLLYCQSTLYNTLPKTTDIEYDEYKASLYPVHFNDLLHICKQASPSSPYPLPCLTYTTLKSRKDKTLYNNTLHCHHRWRDGYRRARGKCLGISLIRLQYLARRRRSFPTPTPTLPLKTLLLRGVPSRLAAPEVFESNIAVSERIAVIQPPVVIVSRS